MQILALSDRVDPAVDSPSIRRRFGGVRLIVGCGDLPASYLEYVVSMLDVPLVYVPGNHDPDVYRVPGGMDVDGTLARVAGLRVAGLGGSPRYKPDGRHQYTEAGMHLRLVSILPRLVLRRLRFGHGLDLLLTHAPPRGIHDGPDVAHRGFLAILRLIRLARPRLTLHGHTHLWGERGPVTTAVHGCRVVNIYPAQVVELDPPS